MFVAKKVVVITKKSQFALDMAKLTARGEFIVTTYASAENAINFLRKNAQHAVIVDFDLLDISGEALFKRIRTLQPDIAVVLAPETPQTQALTDKYDIQALITLPFPIRRLVTVLESAIQSMYDAQPDTVVVPAAKPGDKDKSTSEQKDKKVTSTPPPFDPFAGRTPASDSTATSKQSDSEQNREHDRFRPPPPPHPDLPVIEPEMADDELEEATVFDRLRAEEPPLPSFEQSGTVKDLFDAGEKEWVAPQDTTERSTINSSASKPDHDKNVSIPAALILDRATDDSTPLEGFSITRFMAAIREEFPEGNAQILPLPSWVEEAERYIHEPDFLSEDDMPERSVDYTSSTTAPNALSDETAENVAEWRTERIEPLRRSRPDDMVDEEDTDQPEQPLSLPSTMPEMPDESSAKRPSTMPEMPPVPSQDVDQPAQDEDVIEADEEDSIFMRLTGVMDEAEDATEEGETEVALPEDYTHEIEAESEEASVASVAEPAAIETTHEEDTHFARIALTLTQVSLELASDAILLAQDGQLVAHAGPMPGEDIEDMMPLLLQDWQTPPERGKIRSVHQPSTGQDYMLYSRRAGSDFVLSMLFAGAQPISMIREQAQRMANALTAVPERDVERLFEDDEPEPQVGDVSQNMAIAEQDSPSQSVSIPDVESLFDPLTEEDQDSSDFDEDLLREPVTFVWLLRDLRMSMPSAATDLLDRTLRQQLQADQWHVNDLIVESDYVYLFADIPGENILGKDEIAYLKQTSGDLLQSAYEEVDPETLWADSYMVLTPGRTLDTDDIQRFIRFARR